MIAVFTEQGGERLLGKARELADYSGVRVRAICSEEHKPDAERYISLGADEVLTIPAESLGDWVETFVGLVSINRKLRMILVPSNIVGDLILGVVSARVPDRIGSTLDGVEGLSESGATKSIPLSESVLSVPLYSGEGDKVSIFSLKLGSFPEPFEDTSRYGKVSAAELPSPSSPALGKDVFFIPPNVLNNSSSILTILRGKSASEGLNSEIEKVALKYKTAVLNEEDSPGRVVYGNCLAVNVNSYARDLPQFDGDLVSINDSEDAPISKLANLALITSEPEELLKRLFLS